MLTRSGPFRAGIVTSEGEWVDNNNSPIEDDCYDILQPALFPLIIAF